MRPSFGTKTGATNHEHSLTVDVGPVDKSKPMVCIEREQGRNVLSRVGGQTVHVRPRVGSTKVTNNCFLG